MGRAVVSVTGPVCHRAADPGQTKVLLSKWSHFFKTFMLFSESTVI